MSELEGEIVTVFTRLAVTSYAQESIKKHVLSISHTNPGSSDGTPGDDPADPGVGTTREATLEEVEALPDEVLAAGASEFYQRGAQLDFVVGDNVTYLKISLPSGKVIVKEVGKK